MDGANEAGITSLFVYGTLRAGDVRWPLLAPFVVDEGLDDSVHGSVYDTGRGYPAATFGGAGIVRGRTHQLLEASIARCLDVLDHEEGTVGGHYRRVVVTTRNGIRAWAYEYGRGLDLIEIGSGDWFDR